jgi:hypothetical protein
MNDLMLTIRRRSGPDHGIGIGIGALFLKLWR